MDYTINSYTMYPKHDIRTLNSNSFVNPEVVSLYINYSGHNICI